MGLSDDIMNRRHIYIYASIYREYIVNIARIESISAPHGTFIGRCHHAVMRVHTSHIEVFGGHLSSQLCVASHQPLETNSVALSCISFHRIPALAKRSLFNSKTVRNREISGNIILWLPIRQFFTPADWFFHVEKHFSGFCPLYLIFIRKERWKLKS